MTTHTEPASETTAAEAEQSDGTTSHDVALPAGLAKAIGENWDPAPRMPHPANPSGAVSSGAASFARNRQAVSAAFRGSLIAVPAGRLKVRSNDTDYPFRAWSGLTWLTGETTAGTVLVMIPEGDAHRAVLYVPEYDGPGEAGYFTNRTSGALWVGNVPSAAETAAVLGIETRPAAELSADLARFADTPTVAPRGVDPEVDALLSRAESAKFEEVLAELQLVKDDWEVGQLQLACDATARGFADVAAELPAVLEAGGRRGERWLEGTFWRRARMEGNEVGYTSIVGAGPHATTLHWWRNNGDIASGQLLLADMGVEVDSLFTADITRTMPVSGQWSDAQRKLYGAVLEAQNAGIAEVKSGADFLAAHKAAMWVLADYLHSWGILPVTADVSCAADVEAPDAGLHRRYTLHGVSHMLGIDVHDCAAAREEVYRNGPLAAGYVLTVEPGLYFQPNDLSVPAEWRGIGIRIEDDILVTDGAPMNLSAGLPREPDEITAWMAEAQSRPIVP
jgi:Xaa-Pro aminopeptidase